MSVNKFIIFAIATSFAVFVNIQTTIADDVTFDDYLGTWYTVAMAGDEVNIGSISCSKTTVTKINDDQSFKAVTTTVFNGDLKEFVGTGKWENSKLHTSYQSPINQSVDTSLTSYNNGEELILFSETSQKHYDLNSRTTSVSAETKKIFEKKAASAGLHVININQNDCP